MADVATYARAPARSPTIAGGWESGGPTVMVVRLLRASCRSQRSCQWPGYSPAHPSIGQDRGAKRRAAAFHVDIAHPIGVARVDHGGAIGEVEGDGQLAAVRRDRKLLRSRDHRARGANRNAWSVGAPGCGGMGITARDRNGRKTAREAVDQDTVATGARQAVSRRLPKRVPKKPDTWASCRPESNTIHRRRRADSQPGRLVVNGVNGAYIVCTEPGRTPSTEPAATGQRTDVG